MRRSPRTPCPASSRTSSPAGWPTCSTSAAPTSPPTRRAPPGWPRCRPAVRGLQAGDFDAVVTGGVDRNMDTAGFVKFCKIGALSATGTRPFDAGADGFVMGEGAALFVLKRLSDAERDGDRIYAVLLGLAGASDGRGKGITAPNPVGQRLAVERAWQRRRCRPGAGHLHRGARHVDPRRRRHGAGQPDRRVPQGGRGERVDRAGVGQVQHRPPQGRGRGRGAVQGGDEPARQGAGTQPALRAPQRKRRLGRHPVPGQHRTARLAGARERRALRRGERVRVRRHQLPRRPRGVRARPAPRPRDARRSFAGAATSPAEAAAAPAGRKAPAAGAPRSAAQTTPR